jgi:hypothetical protein
MVKILILALSLFLVPIAAQAQQNSAMTGLLDRLDGRVELKSLKTVIVIRDGKTLAERG